MANAAIAYLNFADAGLLFASTQELTMPAAFLQNAHVARRWRSLAAPAYVVLDLLASQSLDTVALMGLTMGANGTARVRVSTVDSTGAAGDAYNGSVTAVDTKYGTHVELLPAPASGRYVRIDLADPDGSYVEAGRLFAGLRTTFAYNHVWGWSRQWTDRSTRTKTRGGQTQILVDTAFRSLDLTFDFVTEAQRDALVEEIDRVNGMHTDVLLIRDPGNVNLARETLWGLVSDLTAVTQPAIFDIYSKQFKIEERL